jgi:hypothetical protein
VRAAVRVDWHVICRNDVVLLIEVEAVVDAPRQELAVVLVNGAATTFWAAAPEEERPLTHRLPPYA